MCIISFNPHSNLIFIPHFIAEKFEARCYPKSHSDRVRASMQTRLSAPRAYQDALFKERDVKQEQ